MNLKFFHRKRDHINITVTHFLETLEKSPIDWQIDQ